MATPNFQLSLTPESVKIIEQLIKRIGKQQLYTEIVSFFDKQALRTAAKISRNYLSNQRLKRRTGNLSRSMTGRGELVGGVPAIRVGIFRGPSLLYAGQQEFGTKGKNPSSPYDTIRPKNGKALAIPLKPALTPAGVARYQSARDFPEELEFVPILRGRTVGLLAIKTSLDRERKRAQRSKDDFKLENVRAAYLLVKAVDIAPKFYLRDGFVESLPEITSNLAKFLKEYLERK